MKLPKFETKKEKFDYLVKNKTELIELKKSAVKYSDICITPTDEVVSKAMNTEYKDDPSKGVITRKIIANTYNWLDSHGDVHVGNTFAKSIKERATKVFHLHDHKHEVTAKVGRTKEIEEVLVKWSDLGVNKEGETTVLMATSEISEKLNKDVYGQYLDKEIDQHSVGMIYVKMSLAIDDEEYKEEKSTWDKVYPKLGNPEKADEDKYFWVVEEAKLIEYSAVLFGSNELTPTVENIEPLKNTQKEEPNEPTKSLDWNEVISNF